MAEWHLGSPAVGQKGQFYAGFRKGADAPIATSPFDGYSRFLGGFLRMGYDHAARLTIHVRIVYPIVIATRESDPNPSYFQWRI